MGYHTLVYRGEVVREKVWEAAREARGGREEDMDDDDGEDRGFTIIHLPGQLLID